MSCPICSGDHPRWRCSRRPRSGRHVRKTREVVAFDCETTDAGIVLFLASTSDRRVTYIYDPRGLTLDRIIPWMVNAARGRLCAGFYFDYDANQIIRQLPGIIQGQLAANGSVSWQRWRFRHVPSKRFMVSDGRASATIWDVSGWAQCSFVKLCDQWQLGTDAERARVRAMKARRGTFEDATERELVDYTTLECALLAEWVERVIKLHEDCDIQLRAYSGPGSTASAMMRAHGWTPPDVPDVVNRIADAAYFGGRSEISCIGPVEGPIYSYDVNSAYPRAISQLPEIRGARWFRARTHVPGAWGFYRVRWRQRATSAWGLFPMRGATLPDGHRSVSLLYPTIGDGWFHSWEVDAALAVSPRAINVVDAFLIEPKDRPFAWIEDTAQTRLNYKAANDARAFPLKVGLNSIYGKLAQRTGTAPLQCLTYAAAVTAHTRAQLTTLAVQHGHDVFLLATDGILSRAPLPVKVGAGLGEWERCEYPSAWMLQAGVYWAGEKKRTRGIDARGLTLEDVNAAWTRRKTRAEIALSVRRVLSYRLCVAQRKTDLTGTWASSTRTVRFSPAPRRRSYRWDGQRLLTIPARVADYQMVAALDQALFDSDSSVRFDTLEALPDWARED